MAAWRRPRSPARYSMIPRGTGRMPNSLRRQSPLTDFIIAASRRPNSPEAGVHLQERSFLGHVNLRGNPQAGGFLNAIQKCLGMSLPLEANTVIENASVTA